MRTEIACEFTPVSGPAEEPIDVGEAKDHASITQDDEDALLTAWIVAGRQAAESFMSLALFTQTWQMQLEAFADEICLAMAAPLQNVTGGSDPTAPIVQYYDTAGVLQTLAASNYLVDTISEPACIRRAPGVTWPSVQCDRARPILITYVCGHDNVDDIPEIVKQGIRLYVAYADADRIGDASAAASLRAAEACWRAAGQVYWRAPERCHTYR